MAYALEERSHGIYGISSTEATTVIPGISRVPDGLFRRVSSCLGSYLFRDPLLVAIEALLATRVEVSVYTETMVQ
jgi:hypothetical protein